MTFRTLIRRSLRFHWRSHLGVVLGAAVGSAALIGALVVGDSMRETLREQVMQQYGWVAATIAPGDRFFTQELDYRLDPKEGSATHIFAALSLPGIAARTDAMSRANQVNVFGVTHNFFWASYNPQYEQFTNGVILNQALAAKLDAQPGDEVILRVRKPSAFSTEMPIASKSENSVSLRLKVEAIGSPDQMGNFSLRAKSVPPFNAFVRLDELETAMNLKGKANLLLVGDVWNFHPRRWWQDRMWDVYKKFPKLIPRPPPNGYYGTVAQSLTWHSNRLPSAVTLADYELGWHTNSDLQILDLRSARIFLDPPIVEAVSRVSDTNLVTRPFLNLFTGEPELGSPSAETQAFVPNAITNRKEILTYLVNLFRVGMNITPYSMVTAADAPWTPVDMLDDEIIVSQWLANDLQVKPGDEIALSYFDPESGARLVEHTNTFRVRSIVPMETPWADRTLMPDFPGIEKAESTRDWDAGFPLVHKIRQKDEDYWKQHRGTPKAFVTLAAGQKMWGNRFGNLTAIRFPIPTNDASRIEGRAGRPLPAAGTNSNDGAHGVTRPTDAELYRVALEEKILANLKPEELGLRFEPVREQALKAAEESQDFGGLFLGFSFFLIIAALLLMAMLFQFGLEQRTEEIGTLLALGFTPKQVRRLLMGEGIALAFIGGVLGALGGIVYARAMLHGLTTIWRDAVGESALNFHATSQTLVIGLFASTVVCVLTIWLTLRKLARRSARELLAGEVQGPKSKVQSRGRWFGAAALTGAVGLIGWTLTKGDAANAGAFFGAGALLLIAGLSFLSVWLGRLQAGRTVFSPLSDGAQRTARPAMTLGSLAVRGCARRRTRSLSTVAMLACGSFLIVSIGVFRLDANRDATNRSSGTGGFALIGETTMPVVHDLNTPSGREFFALNEQELDGVSFVPFRVREGDEASCLNLNRAQKPKLLGVKPEKLTGRFTFTGFMENTFIHVDPWPLLSKTSVPDRAPVERDEIPAFGDANSIQWAMHKKVGDTIDYIDERGQPFKVRIVGAVANSILQGSLIIDEAEFVKRFPGESGYRTFLIDVPSNSVAQVSATLSRAMQDVGLELTPAAQRLAQFNAVQNTYLGTFQVLGGLGLLLGSVGLGIVVLRNVLERRGELAVLLAVGYTGRMVRRLLLIEHGVLLAVGLGVGVVAAAVAVLPSVLSPGGQLPYQSLAFTLAAVLANGALWTWVAARVALRGNLLAALRNE